jgi:H+/Cl- antiporter ClcA
VIGLSQRWLGQEPADLRSALGRMGSEGLISYRNLLPVMIVAIAGLTFGASLGPEAPLIVLIAGLASASRPAFRRSFARAAAPDLDMVAVTASLGAFFGPLGGVALALEDEDGVRLSKARLLLPGLVSGVLALGTIHALPGELSFESLGLAPYTPAMNGSDLAWAVIPGVAGAALGIILERSLEGGTRLAKMLVPNRVARALAGGIALGLLGALSERLLFSGHNEIAPLIQDAAALGAAALIALALAKIAATTACLATGWFGGEIPAPVRGGGGGTLPQPRVDVDA